MMPSMSHSGSNLDRRVVLLETQVHDIGQEQHAMNRELGIASVRLETLAQEVACLRRSKRERRPLLAGVRDMRSVLEYGAIGGLFISGVLIALEKTEHALSMLLP